MLLFTNDVLRGKLKEQHSDAQVVSLIDSIDFQPFPEVESAVKSDVELLKNHPLVKKDTVITGWIYEVETGQVSTLDSTV
jgi:carbonic anhydrase